MQVVTRFKQPLLVLVALCALIPPIFLANYLANYAIDYPLWDTWKSADIAISAKEGSLTLWQLYDQPTAYTRAGKEAAINGQRVFFTNAVTAVLGWLFNWPIRYEAYVSFILACGTYILLVDLFRRQIEGPWPVILAPFSLLIFTLKDYYNLRWGFQNAYFFTAFFFAAGLWVINRRSAGWWPPVVAAGLALAATFSTPVGFISWPVFFVVLYLAGRRDRTFVLLWAAAALGAVALYAYGYTSVVSSNTPLVDRLLQLSLVANVIMQPVGLSPRYLIVIGFVVIANVITLTRIPAHRQFVLTWAGLMVYTLAAGVLVSILRSQSTIRYVTVAIPFWVASAALTIATIMIIGRQLTRGWWLQTLRITNLAFLGLLVFCILKSDYDSYEPAISQRNDDRETCYLTYPLTREYGCITKLLPNDDVNKWLPAIQSDRLLEKHMSIFGNIPSLPIAGYRDGDAIIVDSDDPLDHVWTAYTTQQENAFHILPEFDHPPKTPPSQFANTIISDTSSASWERFEKFLGSRSGQKTLWYVQPYGEQGQDGRTFGDTFQALVNLSYAPASPLIVITVQGREFIVTEYHTR